MFQWQVNILNNFDVKCEFFSVHLNLHNLCAIRRFDAFSEKMQCQYENGTKYNIFIGMAKLLTGSMFDVSCKQNVSRGKA